MISKPQPSKIIFKVLPGYRSKIHIFFLFFPNEQYHRPSSSNILFSVFSRRTKITSRPLILSNISTWLTVQTVSKLLTYVHVWLFWYTYIYQYFILHLFSSEKVWTKTVIENVSYLAEHTTLVLTTIIFKTIGELPQQGRR